LKLSNAETYWIGVSTRLGPLRYCWRSSAITVAARDGEALDVSHPANLAYLTGPVGRLLRESIRSVSPAALGARAVAVAGVDVAAELMACSVPVLYLRAASDLIIRPGCWELVQSLRPAAEMALLAGPHLVLQVSPAEAATVLTKFCDRLPTRNQTQHLSFYGLATRRLRFTLDITSTSP
jgi:hypothetical protein